MASTEAVDTRSISKFNGENFQVWKFQVKTVFVANGILDIVDGSNVKPASTVNDGADEKSWKSKDAKAMFIISSSMEYTQLECLLTCTSANEMWTKLSTFHEQKSAANVLGLLSRFHEYRMTPGDTAAQHVSKIENLAKQLNDIGEKVSDTMIMAKILSTLPVKFNPFISAWDSVVLENQTLIHLRERVIREEQRMTKMDNLTSALATSSISKQPNREDRLHGSSNTQNSRKLIICHYCEKGGHIERYCRKKMRDLSSGKDSVKANDSDNVSSGTQNSSNFTAFVISTESPKPSSEFFNVNHAAHDHGHANEEESWILDSGASRHVCCRREWFSEFEPRRNEYVYLGDGSKHEICGSGNIFIERFLYGKKYDGVINSVLYVPTLRKNLLSTGVCTELGQSIKFSGEQAEIFTNNGILVAIGVKQRNNLMRMLIKSRPTCMINYTSAAPLKSWHARLGHINVGRIKAMLRYDSVTGVSLTNDSDFFCSDCPLGKQFKLPFDKMKKKKRVEAGDVIFCDLCGPMQTPSVGGARFFLLCKDEATGFRAVFFLKHKDDTYEMLVIHLKYIANLFGRNIKLLRADNGTEFANALVRQLTENGGFKFLTSAPYTPQQNGRAEREMRTIVESARTMLHAANLPTRLWAEAVSTAVYLLNRSLGPQSRKITPFELWTGEKPDLSHTRTFGCSAFARVPDSLRKKWDVKSRELIFVGYENESSNYRLFDLQSGRITVSRDVIFDESSLNIEHNRRILEPADTCSWVPLEYGRKNCNVIPDKIHLPAVDLSDVNAASKRVNADLTPPVDHSVEAPAESANAELQQPQQSPLPDFELERANLTPEPAHREAPERVYSLRPRGNIRQPERFEACLVSSDEPANYREAISCADSAQWKRAIDAEFEAHAKNNTWDVVKIPEGRRPIGFKWVFKVKNPGEKNERYKARLCAQGFSQKAGVDYNEVFSPVVRFESIRVLIAIAARENLQFIQFDVSTAYLNSDLRETTYMRIPDGLNVDPHFVLKLNKALYGLKQSGRCWNEKVSTFFAKLGFVQSSADRCVFTAIFDGTRVYAALYVDDGFFLGRDENILNKLVEIFKSEFDIVTSDFNQFVGIEILRENDSIFIHQAKYIDKILRKFDMIECVTVKTPADSNARLMRPRIKCSLNVPYREAVGSLLFLAMVSRPDIAYAVGVVSRYLDNYDKSHWHAVQRIMSYLKGTRDYGLLFTSKSGGNALAMVGFSDSDYAADIDTRRSTAGYLFMMSAGCVTWSSKRQPIVTMSTTEAEFVAACEACKEAIWLRKLLLDIGHECIKPTILNIDNQSTIKLIKNPEFHQRSKHIGVRYYFINEKSQEGAIEPEYVSTHDQYADIFTKALPYNTFAKLRERMSIVAKTLK